MYKNKIENLKSKEKSAKDTGPSKSRFVKAERWERMSVYEAREVKRNRDRKGGPLNGHFSRARRMEE
jgi:hypothetical protein